MRIDEGAPVNIFQVPTGISVAVAFIQGQAVASYNTSLPINTKIEFDLTFEEYVELPVRLLREDGSSAYANGELQGDSLGVAV